MYKNGTFITVLAAFFLVANLEAQDIKIGSQVWATKNLDLTTYRNGDTIPQVQDPVEWANLTTGAWCYYQNETANGITYGKLYNWYAVNDPRGLAPKGYRIPNDADWTRLTDYLCIGQERCLSGRIGIGRLMKSTKGWNNNNNGTNESGFEGLPGGYRSRNGSFDGIGNAAYWWSISERDAGTAWYRALDYDYSGNNVGRFSSSKRDGLSVRCIKD